MSDFLPDLSLPPEADQLRAVDTEAATSASTELVIETVPTPFGRGYAFDPRLKGFIVGEQGKGVLQTHGLDTLKVLILKTIYTQRGVHPIYSDDFGMDDPTAPFGGPLSDSAIGEWEEMLRTALTKLPRVVDIQDYAAEPTPMGDGYSVSFSVVLDDDTVIPVPNQQLPL